MTPLSLSRRIKDQRYLLKRTSDPVLAQMANTTLNRLHDEPEYLRISETGNLASLGRLFEQRFVHPEDLVIAAHAQMLIAELLRKTVG